MRKGGRRKLTIRPIGLRARGSPPRDRPQRDACLTWWTCSGSLEREAERVRHRATQDDRDPLLVARAPKSWVGAKQTQREQHETGRSILVAERHREGSEEEAPSTTLGRDPTPRARSAGPRPPLRRAPGAEEDRDEPGGVGMRSTFQSQTGVAGWPGRMGTYSERRDQKRTKPR